MQPTCRCPYSQCTCCRNFQTRICIANLCKKWYFLMNCLQMLFPFPTGKGKLFFLESECIILAILLLSWCALDRLDPNEKCEAFSSVFWLCYEREAIILSPAGGMSKFQLCSALSNLLSLMLIIFLLASTLWGEANNTVFVLQRLCTFIKWCWHNPSLQIPFLLQQPTDWFFLQSFPVVQAKCMLQERKLTW